MVFIEKECCVWYSFFIYNWDFRNIKKQRKIIEPEREQRMKQLPVGIESFSKIIQNNYYYVDKTNMIKDLLNSISEVTLFTRPRRFGKSLNMDMLKSFFKAGTDTSLFNGLAISKEKELCEKYQGKYPVISLSLKDVGGMVFEDFIDGIKIIISRSAYPYKRLLLQSSQLDDDDKENARCIAANKFKSMADVYSSLNMLSRLLYQHYGKKVIIIIDEYDVPLDKAYQSGFYDEMVKFMRLFFGSALKTNEYLEFAVLTGCLRISKESIFTGLNNFKVIGISDTRFSEYFGFTGTEVKEMLEYYGLEDKYTLFKEWYDGYRFGNTEVYCPWDVINQCGLLYEDGEAPMQSYWINSSGNDIVRDILKGASANTKGQIESLVSEESIKRTINTDLTYADLKNADKVQKETYLWSILYATGYLTDAARPEGKIHTLVIPNKEILEIYKEQVLYWFNTIACQDSQWGQLCSAVENGDAAGIETALNNILPKSISIRDTYAKKDMKENFYHGLLIGLFLHNERWVVKSEQESGEGYPDILVKAVEKGTGCVFEIKYAGNGRFDEACGKAMQQIKEKKYVDILKQEGIETIYLYGIAFYRKSCKVIYEIEKTERS